MHTLREIDPPGKALMVCEKCAAYVSKNTRTTTNEYKKKPVRFKYCRYLEKKNALTIKKTHLDVGYLTSPAYRKGPSNWK